MALEIIRITQCDVIGWDDLTTEQQGEFDYLDTDERQQYADFVVYQDWPYDINEFMFVNKHSPFHADMWDGYLNDSFFSGVLIRFTDSNETAKLATFIS